MSSKDATIAHTSDFHLPPNLTVEQQIVICVGQLVVEWAVCESILRGVYVAITGGTSSTARDFSEVAWLSTSNTNARCDLLTRATFAANIPETFKKEIKVTISHFKGVTRTRNFFCHAAYEVNPDTFELVAVEGHHLTLNEELVEFDRRTADKAMVHSLLTAITNCGRLAREGMGLVLALQSHLGAHFPELPALPDGYPIFPAFLLRQTE